MASPALRRWPFFLIGVLLFLLGPAIYVVQLWLSHLGTTPWYMPILATVAVLLMAVSVWRRRGIVRWAGLILFVVLCALAWFHLLVGTRTPLYTGPAQASHKVPAFATTLADGSAFTDKDLEKGMPTVLLFFRGRW